MNVCKFLVASSADVTSKDGCLFILWMFECNAVVFFNSLTPLFAVQAALPSNAPSKPARVTLRSTCKVSGHLHKQLHFPMSSTCSTAAAKQSLTFLFEDVNFNRKSALNRAGKVLYSYFKIVC
jgi:hypothetical protein